MNAIKDWLWAPYGEWRTQLVWRLFGWTLIQFAMLKNATEAPDVEGNFPMLPLADYWSLHPWSFHALSLTGLALVVFGLRPIILIALTILSTLVFRVVLSAEVRTLEFPAVEWCLHIPLVYSTLIGVMLIGALSGSMPPDRRRLNVDWCIVWVFRVTLIVALVMAAFHKLNTDFFNREVSCMMLRDSLTTWWGIPHEALESAIGPIHIIVLELALPLLLIFAPRVGLLLTLLVMLQFGSIGATRFSGLIITTAFAFLPATDYEVLRAGFKRWRIPIAISVVAAVAASAFAYIGPRPWLQYGVYHGVFVVLLWAAFLVLVPSIRSKFRRQSRPELLSFKPMKAVKAFIVIVALLNFFNTITPYLGLKFQYSMAMLSNLRVDDDRWNSFVVPQSVRLTEHDPFIHVTRAEFFLPPDATFASRPDITARVQAFETAVYSPDKLRSTLFQFWNRGVWVGLDYSYRGQEYRFADGDDRDRFAEHIRGLPSTPLFQEKLNRDRPQTCKH